MKILLITPYKKSPSLEIKIEAEKRGHQVEILPLNVIDITDIKSNKIVKKMLEYDVIYIRTGPLDIVINYINEYLKKNNKLLINSKVYSANVFNNKIFQVGKIASANINVPKSVMSSYLDFIKIHKGENIEVLKEKFFLDLVKEISLPLIVKPLIGARGKNVYKINNYQDFLRFISKFENTAEFLFQEFIPNNGDYRVIVVGGKVIGLFKRVPSDGEFRANIALGGRGEIVTDQKLVKQIGDFALKACQVLEIEIGGVDVILSDKNGMLYFIEVNRSMQWEGFRETTGINVAAHIIEYFETLPV